MITRITRIVPEAVDTERALRFSLAVLKRGPLLPLQPEHAQDNPVVIAEDSPWPYEILDDIRRVLGFEVRPLLAPKEVILMELNRIFDMASTSAEKMLEDLDDYNSLSHEIEEVKDILDSDDEAPVIRLVNTLIGQALRERASDIHIEPFESEVLVRFRVDGVLYTAVKPPKSVQSAMVSRIKVMADLDIAEKRHPQDGRFRMRIAGREVDVRVSVLPTAYGERVVMRLLDRSSRMLTLKELGYSDEQMRLTKQVLKAPHGIVLVTGPTGSGKTTSLYASLMMVDRENRNVLTIEDPIEYQLQGVGQMQVQSKIGVSFSQGLRSILRQDPDIIMIGEIRDLETAEIAIQASLTGHLVFSTLHTNDALSAIVRLQDMGVEPYLVASSLLMVQAQRLVRQLCPDCKVARPATATDWKLLGVDATQYADVSHIYEAGGCDHCMQTGYLGRKAVFEMAQISGALRAAIHDEKNLAQLRKIAAQEKMYSLAQDGSRHVAAGITSMDEILRVTLKETVDDIS
ncbi:MAG: type II secretion system ATPase GspE [Mariprofundaceae bacterium]|nr:type II secretion system ATPase GspE [Mariprofundaceae bacterium]